MGNIFVASEMVEIGIQIEVNGRAFYETLAKETKSEKAKEVFEFLKGEEEKHIAVFKGILNTVAQYEPPESYSGEYIAYMRALADEHIFIQKNKGDEVAKRVRNDFEAIDLGIGFEKDSILFYEGMKKAVPDYDTKIVDDLIAQEQNHLRQLANLKNML